MSLKAYTICRPALVLDKIKYHTFFIGIHFAFIELHYQTKSSRTIWFTMMKLTLTNTHNKVTTKLIKVNMEILGLLTIKQKC